MALSSRKRSVLVLLAEGRSNRGGAGFEHSVRTVETHRKSLKRKLGISSTADFTRYVIENDLKVAACDQRRG